MALALALLALVSLVFIAGLTVDGLRALIARRSREAARRPLTLVVAERREVAGQLISLKLRHPRHRALPRFHAGQHLLLSAPAGRNGSPIKRNYSLAAWNQAPTLYELGIKREPQGTVSQWLWANLHLGDTVQVSPPQGHFLLQRNRRLLVLIGGGIGITPMRAMLHEALADARQVALIHAAQDADLLLYRAEFETLAAGCARLTYVPIISRPDSTWPGLSGRLEATQVLGLVADAQAADFYLCASSDMMAALRQGLVAHGVSADQIHCEAFGAGAMAATLPGLNITVDVGGTEQIVLTGGEPTLLATLEANGIDLPSECRAGSCGRCATRLEAGEVAWLTAPEFAVDQCQILPCICAAKTDVRLSVG